MSLTEIRKALSVMVTPGDVVELRIFEPNGKKFCGWFDDMYRMAEAALSHDDTAEGTYYTCNSCILGMLAIANNRIVPCQTASQEQNIIRRRIFGLDVDPDRNPQKISSTDGEKQLSYNRALEVRAWLSSQGWPLPVLGDSGNGYHLDYFVDLPNTPEIKKLYEDVYKSIKTKFPKDAVDVQGFADANRIWKLYGTVARKGENMPDRPHRRSKLLEIPDNREQVNIEMLQKIADLLPKEEPTGTNRIPKNGKSWNPEKLESYLKEHGAVIERTKKDGDITRFVLKTCLINPDHEGHKEAEAHINSNGIIGYKCHHNSCKDVSWVMVREKLDPEYKEKKEKSRQFMKSLRDDYHLSDLGNAQRIKDSFGEEIRYCHPQNKWYVWDDKRWNIDREAYLETCARGIVDQIYKDGFDATDLGKKQKLIEFALKCESVQRIKNMIELTKSESGIPILPDAFDADPMLFNVQNGTVDLRSGILKEHDQKDFITKISPIKYDPEAKCPLWLSFLDKIFAGNKDLIEYEQRRSGYRMTGEVKEEDIDINFGNGQNGKSKFFDELVYIMGDYHKKINVETIAEVGKRDGNTATSDVACLKGIRFVTVSEPQKEMKLDEGRIKDWTGRDKITARHLYSEQFDFYAEFKIDLYTNHKPVIKGLGKSMWRRIKLVPFSVTISDDEKDVDLGEKLKKESSGILNWMIQGCLMWQKDGLKVPEEILQATEEYKKEQDYLGDFFRECCEIGKDYKVPFKWIHLTYRAYSNVMDMPVQSHVTFASTLSERGYKVKHTDKGNIYTGIRLKVNIEEKCHEINSASADLRTEGLKVLSVFLETFLNQFSYGDFTEKPSEPSEPSLNKPTDNEKTNSNPSANNHNPSLIATTGNEKKPSVHLPSDKDNIPEYTRIQRLIHDGKNRFESEFGVLNSSNINTFSMKFCDWYDVKIPDNSKDLTYTPSAIKLITSKLFKLTPEVSS